MVAIGNSYRKSIIFLSIIYLILLIVGRFYYGEVYNNIPKNNGSGFKGDQNFYDTTAINISKGKGYSYDGDKPTSNYQVGYPLFLGSIYYIFGHNYRIVITIQIFLTFFVFILYAILAMKINKSLFFISAILFISNYFFIQRAYSLMTETLALFLFTMSLFLFYYFLQQRRIHFIYLLGVVYGCLILVRPIFQLYPLWMLTFSIIFIFKKKYKTFLKFFLFFSLSLIIILPVLVRNHKKFGFFSLSSLGGMMFYVGTSPDYYNGVFPSWGKMEEDLNLQKYYGNKKQNFGDLETIGKISLVNKVFIKGGLNNIKKHPLRAIFNICKSTGRLIFFISHKDHKLSLQRLILSAINMISFASMLISLYYMIIKRIVFESSLRQFLIFCYSLFFYYILISSFFPVDPRYGIYPTVLIYLLSPIWLMAIKPKLQAK
jgi:hypothetical protein